MFENRNFFKGEIDATTINNIKILDYKETTYLGRLKIVEKALKETNFFTTYIDKYYKTGLTSKDYLSSQINVFKKLEQITDYLLSASDVKASKEKVEYCFYKNKHFFQQKIKEQRVPIVNSKDCEIEVIDFLLLKNQNHYLSKNQIITKKDLQRQDYVGQILREYNEIYETLKDKNNNKLFFGRKIMAMKEIKEDMILTKNMLDKPIEFFDDSLAFQKNNYDNFDWKNPNHVKAILQMNRDLNPEDDLSHIILDLDIYIKKIYGGQQNKTKTKQYKILKLLRQGYSQQEICNILNDTNCNINRIIKTIVKNICNYAEN